jgi:hypothetical protein
MSRDIVDRSLRTCRTLVVGLVGAFGVDAVLGDEFSVAGEHADVAVVDEEEDTAAFVCASDAEVAEFAGVAEGDFAGLVDAVVADAERAGVADGCCGGRGCDAGGVGGSRCLALVGALGTHVVVVGGEDIEVCLEFDEGSSGGIGVEVILESAGG